ncbi:MAG TPA: PIN domain-containing protein [Allosphingosinicella sp.]|jgi:hypothetical protein
MERVVVFTDTNGFIQVRDLKDLPWTELFPGVREVIVMVARPVISELDRHKVSTKARCRNRARAALKLIDEASDSPDRSITLREEPIKVTLTVAPRVRPNWDELPDLDASEPDDQLVAAALNIGDGAVLLSHDSGPRISARDVGLTAYEPPASWLLPPEQTEDQKKAARLERQLQEAVERQPRIEITFAKAANGHLTLYRPKLPPLDRAMIAELRDRYLDMNPKAELQATVFPFGVGHHPAGFRTPDDVEQYNLSHAMFVREVGTYFEKLHERAAAVAAAAEINFKLFNAGGASAEHLKVTLDLAGQLGILATDEDVKRTVGSMKLPAPPKVPKKRHNSFDDPLSSDRTSSLLGFNPRNDIHLPQDPTEMRWLDRPEYAGQHGSYGCPDFRPKRQFDDTIWLWPQSKLPASGALTVTASANHLEEVSATVEITLEERAEAWASESVLELFPVFVGEALQKRR